MNVMRQTKQHLHFRYLENDRVVYMVYRPYVSSRSSEYYTEKHDLLTTTGNVVKCYVNEDIAKKVVLEKQASLLTTDLKNVKIIADDLKLPLFVSINTFCDIEDNSEIEEGFFWSSMTNSQH